MIALLQRVTQAKVTVGSKSCGEIDQGLLVFLGVEKNDTEAQAERLVERITGYRVFEDDAGKMNMSLKQTGGGLLLVPQFTLAAETGRGMRPSFSSAAPPDLGRAMFDRVVELSRETGAAVETGEFGADMQVSLINDGPVTFWLEVK